VQKTGRSYLSVFMNRKNGAMKTNKNVNNPDDIGV
jgi:hypothetical protein